MNEQQLDLDLPRVLYCPCCHQEVEDVTFIADPETNTITNGEKTIELTSQQFRLAKHLIDKFPRTATKEGIYDTVFMNSNGEGPAIKIVDVIICKIRPHLADIGLVIETVWGKGYKVLQTDPKLAEEIKQTSIRMRAKGASQRWKTQHDDTLLDLMKRKFTISQCATQMRMPYMTIERHTRRLQPYLSKSLVQQAAE